MCVHWVILLLDIYPVIIFASRVFSLGRIFILILRPFFIVDKKKIDKLA